MSDPAGSGGASVYGTEPDTELLSRVTARAFRHATKVALIITACWYLVWFAMPVAVTAWAGLIVFVAATGISFPLLQMLLLRQVADEFRRRKELIAFRDKYKAQTNSST